MGWKRVGAPLMPDDALIEFPPGLASLSRRWTGMPWEISWEAAESPASPDPTTMAPFIGIGNGILVPFMSRMSRYAVVKMEKEKKNLDITELHFMGLTILKTSCSYSCGNPAWIDIVLDHERWCDHDQAMAQAQKYRPEIARFSGRSIGT